MLFRSVRVWDLSTGECVRVLDGHTGKITSLAVLSDDRVVSGSYDRRLRVWDLSEGGRVRVLDGLTSTITSLAVLSDGRVVSGSYDRTVRVWDLSTGEFEVVNHRLLDNLVCRHSIRSALNSFGLPHVTAYCELTKSSDHGGAGLVVGMKSGEIHFLTLLVSKYKFQSC